MVHFKRKTFFHSIELKNVFPIYNFELSIHNAHKILLYNIILD